MATHEQGHFTGLGDLYNNVSQGSGTNGYQECMGRNNQQKTMFGFIGTGATDARDLHPADRLGQQWLYGRLALPIASGANNENLFDYFCSSASAPVTCSTLACTPKIRWNSLPVSYHIRTADFLPEHVQLLQQGFGVWNAVPDSDFAASYAGDSSVDVASTDDGVPVLRVSNPGSPEDRMILGGNALAVTGFAWFISSGNMSDADITFNHAIEFSPPLPAIAIPTPTPVEEEGGGGCGTVGTADPPPASGLGSLLLAAILAASLLRGAGHRTVALRRP